MHLYRKGMDYYCDITVIYYLCHMCAFLTQNGMLPISCCSLNEIKPSMNKRFGFVIFKLLELLQKGKMLLWMLEWLVLFKICWRFIECGCSCHTAKPLNSCLASCSHELCINSEPSCWCVVYINILTVYDLFFRFVASLITELCCIPVYDNFFALWLP